MNQAKKFASSVDTQLSSWLGAIPILIPILQRLNTDILGFLKSFAITVEELETAMEEGMGFDGSSIEGFARIDEIDMRYTDALTMADNVMTYRLIVKEVALMNGVCSLSVEDW